MSFNEVQAELSFHNLDGVLGILGAVSMDALQRGPEFYHSSHQKQLLASALGDNFPEQLSYRCRYNALNVERHGIVHTQNLAWLSHQALLNAKRGGLTSSFNNAYRARMIRLLLVANDHLNQGTSIQNNIGLKERKRVALDFLRHWQFSQSFGVGDFFRSLMRHRTLLLERLPHYFDVCDVFKRVTGVGLDVYFAVVAAITSQLFLDQLKRGEENHPNPSASGHWLVTSPFVDELEDHKEEVKAVLSWWSTTPERYEERYRAWRSNMPNAQPDLDFVQLRITPLIEARPGELVCPVAHFLLMKVVDEPYFLLSERLPKAERERFQVALGNAYNDYANELIASIAANVCQGAWNFTPNPPRPGGGGELSDALLSRADTAVVFEHKALRLNTEFLLGGSGDRVLGPPDKVLEQLEVEKRSAGETKGEDKGLLTRGMNQQTRTASAIQRYARHKFGSPFLRVYAVLTHLADLHVDRVVYEGYLERLLERNQLYPEAFWVPPQWLHIESLEHLASWAEAGDLDLEELFSQKARAHRYERFDVFLANLAASRERPLQETQLSDRLNRAMDEAYKLLYPSHALAELNPNESKCS